MVWPESDFRYRETEFVILRCLDRGEEKSLASFPATAVRSYREIKSQREMHKA